MRATLLALLLMAVNLAGCTASYVWDKPGLTVAEFARDDDECRRASATGETRVEQRQMYVRCMKARGYTAKN